MEGEALDIGEVHSAKDAARRIAGNTIPGEDNGEFPSSLSDAAGVVDDFIEETNNWFEIVDVRVYRGDEIGLPCRYRWTIKRWVSNEMDSWLMSNGWERIAHLKADSREHRDNEMEARYRKEIDGYTVHLNAYVEFTSDVFRAMKNGNPIKRAEEQRQRKERAEKFLQEKRGD